jgi:hypothetical protein
MDSEMIHKIDVMLSKAVFMIQEEEREEIKDVEISKEVNTTYILARQQY